jgi:hypothetical protein
MDFFSLFGLSLYGDAVNKYKQPVKYENEIGNIPRYYENIYECNQINNNKTKVFSDVSNNFVNSLLPNTNIINKIWRMQKKDTYNQIQQNDIYDKKQQNDIYDKKQQNGEYKQMHQNDIHEHFITDDIGSFFDKIKNYSFISIICLILVSCICFCM